MASTGRNTTFILLIMLSIVVFLFLNMVLGSVRIPMSAVEAIVISRLTDDSIPVHNPVVIPDEIL